jgi:hypothetical protein
VFGKKPIVHIYMPRGIDSDERNRYHPRFQSNLSALLKAALSSNRQVLVTGRSYGVHQALRVIRKYDSPRILLIGVAPAFGAFGNQYSANVKQYVTDVKLTRSKYCMVASEDDGFTWRSGGAAYKRRIGYRGDNDVGRAAERNKKNVTCVRLNHADHTPIDNYIKRGLDKGMKQCAYHFAMRDTPLGAVTRSYGSNIDLKREACLEYCGKSSRCIKCSESPGCGLGAKNLRSWTGEGNNWYACQKTHFAKESDKNHAACMKYCNSNSKCRKCSTNFWCGRGYKRMKSWKGSGKNWHACKKR